MGLDVYVHRIISKDNDTYSVFDKYQMTHSSLVMNQNMEDLFFKKHNQLFADYCFDKFKSTNFVYETFDEDLNSNTLTVTEVELGYYRKSEKSSLYDFCNENGLFIFNDKLEEMKKHFEDDSPIQDIVLSEFDYVYLSY